MFHLIYTSREKQAFDPLGLKSLLLNARIRNHEVDVTGILIYHSGMFLQTLEGEAEAVQSVFSRIENDARHGDLRVLGCNATVGKRRMFGDWSMGFADAAGAAQILKGFIDLKSEISFSSLDEVRALDILKTCSKEPRQISA
jgi:hypothetical protein